jgi:hypothetical protein
VTDRTNNPTAVIKAIQSEYLYVLKQHLTEELRQYLPFAAATPSMMHCLYVQPETNARIEIPRSGAPPLSPGDYRTQCLADDIIEFWLRNGETLLDAIAGCKGFATSIFTEMTPVEPFKKYGLYFDMLCIEDRIFGDASASRVQDRPIGRYLYGSFRGKHLSLLLLEPLLTANTDPPLAVIYPDPHFLSLLREGHQAQSDTLSDSAKIKTFRFFQRLFPHLTTAEELPGLFSRRIDSQTRRALEDCPFLREMSGGNSVKNLSQRYAFQTTAESSHASSPNFESLDDAYIGWNVFRAVNTKIYQQERVSLFFNRCRVDPLLDDLSWPVFKWDLGAQAADSVSRLGFSEELAIPKVIENPRLSWLGNIAIEDLVELHQTKQLAELRALFAKYRKEIRFADPAQFDNVCDAVADGINAAVNEYETLQKSAIRKLALRRGITYVTFVVSGGLAIASIACPALLPLALASTAVGMTVGSSVANIVDDKISVSKSRKELADRPLGILLRIKLKAEQSKRGEEGKG